MKINSFIENLKQKMDKERIERENIEDFRTELQKIKNQMTVMAIFFDEIRTLLTDETESGKTKLNARGRAIQRRNISFDEQ